VRLRGSVGRSNRVVAIPSFRLRNNKEVMNMVFLSSTGSSLGYVSQLGGNPYIERVSLGFVPFTTEKGRLWVGSLSSWKAHVANYNKFIYSMVLDRFSNEKNFILARAKWIDTYGRVAVRVSDNTADDSRIDGYKLGKIYLFTEGRAFPMSSSFIYAGGIFDDVDRCAYGGMMASNIVFNGLRFWPYSQIEWLKETWKNHYGCSDRIPLPMEFESQTMGVLPVLYQTMTLLNTDSAKHLYNQILRCLKMRLYYLENYYEPTGRDGKFRLPIILYLEEAVFLAAYRAYIDRRQMWNSGRMVPGLVFVRGRLVRECKDHIVRGVHLSASRIQHRSTRILSRGMYGQRLSNEPVHEIMLESIGPIKDADYWVFMISTGFLSNSQGNELDPVVAYFSAWDFHSRFEKFLLEFGLKFRREWTKRFRDPSCTKSLADEIRQWFYDRGFNIRVWEDDKEEPSG
jgi:hypothetical protein